MQKRVFFRNAAIMTVTSLILRSIGILFRIYVSNRIGAEGMGLYQLILSVYILMASFATSGLTTAVTRLCTDELAFGRGNAAKRVLYQCMWMSIGIGFLSGILLYGFSNVVAVSLLHDTRAVPSLKILTVSLPFMGMSSCIKGYFLARRKVTSSSIAQITEQLVRIGVIVTVLNVYHVQSVEGACFAVLFGDTVAEAVSFIYMWISYLLDKRHLPIENESKQTGVLRRIVAISVPITGGRYLNSGLRTIESIMVPQALLAYTASAELSLSQFGALKGMALPIIFFPASFLTAFSSLLIPEISQANALSQHKHLTRTVQRALHWTLLSSLLISGIFVLLSYPLGMWLYHDNAIGRYLLLLAPLAPIMYLESVIVGILKGLDQQTHSLIYSVWDSVIRIVLIVIIVPSFGIDGFYAVMVISNLLTCGLNLHRLCKVTGVRIRICKWIIKPVFALVPSVSLPYWLTEVSLLNTSKPMVYAVTCVILTGSMYTILVWLLKCIDRDDLIKTVPIRKNANNNSPVQ